VSSVDGAEIRLGPSGYDSAWSSLLWLRDDFKVQPDPMWITQLSHWTTALEAQDKADKGGSVSTFASFNTRMICRESSRALTSCAVRKLG
jgi:FKBP12-rapamycin complex-associated protein